MHYIHGRTNLVEMLEVWPHNICESEVAQTQPQGVKLTTAIYQITVVYQFTRTPLSQPIRVKGTASIKTINLDLVGKGNLKSLMCRIRYNTSLKN